MERVCDQSNSESAHFSGSFGYERCHCPAGSTTHSREQEYYIGVVEDRTQLTRGILPELSSEFGAGPIVGFGWNGKLGVSFSNLEMISVTVDGDAVNITQVSVHKVSQEIVASAAKSKGNCSRMGLGIQLPVPLESVN
jgi:hypothetical protein